MRFLLAIFAGVGLILTALALAPISDDRRLNEVLHQDQRLRMVLDRIRTNPAPIDIAFLGSSHTASAIDDQALQASLGVGHVVNLGANWMGRDMHVFLLKELQKHKSPRLVVIEINEAEHPFGHRLLPFAGGLQDVLCCHAYLDPTIIKRLATFWRQQALHLAGLPFDLDLTPSPSIKDHTWQPLEGTRSDPTRDLISSKSWFRDLPIMSVYGLKAVDEIARLTTAHGMMVAFLYQPNFVNMGKPPREGFKNYAQYGPIMMMPPELGSDPKFWYDDGHINRDGVRILTPDLARQVKLVLSR